MIGTNNDCPWMNNRPRYGRRIMTHYASQKNPGPGFQHLLSRFSKCSNVEESILMTCTRVKILLFTDNTHVYQRDEDDRLKPQFATFFCRCTTIDLESVISSKTDVELAEGVILNVEYLDIHKNPLGEKAQIMITKHCVDTYNLRLMSSKIFK